jgi:hypothetical protein
MRGAAPAIVALLLATALSGCTHSGDADVHVQESLRVGERYFDFGDAEFMRHGVDPELHARTVRADFDVTADTARIGVSFQGLFAWENSTATLTLTRPDGASALALKAAPGLQDSVGTIGALFEFHEHFAVTMPGPWKVAMEGRGNITSVDFSVHGITGGTNAVERTFRLEDDKELSVLLDVRGWGRTPTARLEHPDGSSTALPLSGARTEVTHTPRVTAGEHRLVIDTTGWGGLLILQVKDR